MQSFSAKDLCCRSSMQIKLFTEYPEKRPKPNVNIINGETYQHNIAKSIKNLVGEEMRGTFILNDVCINFSNDIVCNDYIMEVKSVSKDKPLEEWYFNSSLVQCAVYSSLLRKGDGKLRTSSFFIEQGNPLIECVVKPDIDYCLNFGGDIYDIKVNNADEIVNFIVSKARSTYEWETARKFDYFYKHREFEVLKDFFTFNKR